jgi:FixJ family two-component response regulator
MVINFLRHGYTRKRSCGRRTEAAEIKVKHERLTARQPQSMMRIAGGRLNKEIAARHSAESLADCEPQIALATREVAFD